MSGTQVSTFPSTNDLYNIQAAEALRQQNQLTYQRNPLLLQEDQQKIAGNEMETMGRAAMGLLSLPDETARAAAYPGVVSYLQGMNFAKNAPAEYPGEARLRGFVAQAIPTADSYRLQLGRAALDAVYPTAGGGGASGGGGGTTGAAPGGSGTAAPGVIEPDAVARAAAVRDGLLARGLDYDTATAFAANALHESSANPNTGAGDQGASHGLFQWRDDRAARYKAIMGGAPDNAPLGQQLDYVVNELNTTEGAARDRIAAAQGPAAKAAAISQFYLRPKDVDAEMARRSATAQQLAAGWPAPATAGMSDQQWLANQGKQYPSLASAAAGTPGESPPPAAAPPATAPGGGVAARYPGAVQAAGPAAGPPVATPGAPAGAPLVAQNGLAPPVPQPPPPAQQAQQVPGGPPPPPTVQRLPPVPLPPVPQPTNAQGLTAQDQQDLGRLKAGLAASGNPNGAQLLQAEIDRRVQRNTALQQQYLQAVQKQREDARSEQQLGLTGANTTLEYWKAAHPDAKVTQSGGEIITQDPRTGQEIAPRIPVTPDRPETAAAVTLSRLAPKIAAGTATPEEQAAYATQAEVYRAPRIETDPLTKALIRVNSRELPEGFPEPPPIGGGASTRASGGGPQKITPGQSIAQQHVEEQLGKDFAEKDTKTYHGTNDSLYSLGEMNNAAEVMNRSPGSWTSTGPGANVRLGLGQSLNTIGGLLGFDPKVDPAAIGSWEALNKQTKLMGFKMINAAFGASREAASVIQNATSAVPNSENSYLGFRLVSSGIEQELARERELYEYKSQLVKNGQPLATSEADFNKTHPVDVYTNRAIANAVPEEMVSYLQAHPDTVKAFDGHFGPGIGEFILRGGRTGMGAEARRQ